MKDNLLIILVISIFIVCTIICFLIFFIWKNNITKNRQNLIQKYGEKINMNSIDKMSGTIGRVSLISTNNSKLKGLLKRLTNKYDQTEEELKAVRLLLSSLLISYKKLRKSNFNKAIEKIDIHLQSLKSIDKEFNIEARRIMQQDELVRSEFIYLQSNLRKIINIYKIKRLFMGSIVLYVDELLDQVKNKQKEFPNFLGERDSKHINTQIIEFERLIKEIAKIVDEAPALQTYLSKTIPEKTKKLLKVYKNKKVELKTDFKNLNFIKSIEEIKNKYNIAKKRFKDGAIDKTSSSIKQILKSLKMMERMVNIEIQSRNIFIDNYKIVINLIEESFNAYVGIKHDFKNMNKKLIIQELEEIFFDLKEESKQLDAKSTNFLDLIKKTNIPFSHKLSRMKIILKELNIFIMKVNETTLLIWEHKNNHLKIKNKYIRMVNAIETLGAEIKNENIITSTEERNRLRLIDQELMEIANFIDLQIINKEQAKKVDIFLERATSYYQIVSAKTMMAKLIRDLIYKLAAKRSIESYINHTMELAERKYLQGEYASSLNILISMIEEE